MAMMIKKALAMGREEREGSVVCTFVCAEVRYVYYLFLVKVDLSVQRFLVSIWRYQNKETKQQSHMYAFQVVTAL